MTLAKAVRSMLDECMVKSDGNGHLRVILCNEENVPMVVSRGQNIGFVQSCMFIKEVPDKETASINFNEKSVVRDDFKSLLNCKMYSNDVSKII